MEKSQKLTIVSTYFFLITGPSAISLKKVGLGETVRSCQNRQREQQNIWYFHQAIQTDTEHMMGDILIRKSAKIPEERIRAKNEAKILKAAVDLFSRKGFDGTSITEIARISGLPKANVYYYFPRKKDIYTRLIEKVMDGWDKALEQISPEREPREALSDYIGEKLSYSRENGVESRFFANEMLRGGQFFSTQQKAHMRSVTRKYVEVLNHWMANGKMIAVDPNHFFIMLWGATEYYANFSILATETLEKRQLSEKDFAQAHATIAKTILDGCLT
jgi:TetR/AcrR family transcriptional regulator